MLNAKTEQQKEHIKTLVKDGLLCVTENGVKVDGVVTFDEMLRIVDFLRASVPNKELFEKCWVAYRRKGIKKKATEYWAKLTDEDKEKVLPHIKAYVASRDVQYQKDFERYLRDKVFNCIVYANNKVVYDPTKTNEGVYMPTCDVSLMWNEYYQCYMYVGYWDGKHIADGYADNDRPNGASITLNNGRGTIIWNSETKTWNKI